MRKLFKLFIPVIALLLVVSAPSIKVYAGEISTLEASGVDSGVLINGTAGAGVLAVSICIYEADGTTLINLYTTAIDSTRKYTYDYSLPAGDYVIKVADYDGGPFLTKNVTVPSSSSPSPDSGDDDSGDDGDSGSNSGVAPTTPAKTPAPAGTAAKQPSDKNTTKNPDTSVSDKDKKDSATDKNKDADMKKPDTDKVGDGKDTGATDTIVLTNPSSQDDVKTNVGLSKPAKILLWTLLAVIIAAVITGFIIILAKRKKIKKNNK